MKAITARKHMLNSDVNKAPTLKFILAKIKMEALDGYTRTEIIESYQGPVSKRNLTALKKLGYRVSTQNNTICGKKILIGWGR